jgi:hypothetical protein
MVANTREGERVKREKRVTVMLVLYGKSAQRYMDFLNKNTEGEMKIEVINKGCRDFPHISP